MNKGELIESVHHHLREREVSKALAADAVNAVLHAIHHSLSHGGHVSIAGFGSFILSPRAARAGRNPPDRQGTQDCCLEWRTIPRRRKPQTRREWRSSE